MTSLTARVFDASDNLIGTGLIHHITRASITERLDEIPTFQVTLPLAAPRNKTYIEQASIIALYDDFEEIARGVINRVDEQDTSLIITCADLMSELAYPETGPEYALTGVPLWQAVGDALTSYAPTWTASVATAGDRRCENTFQSKQLYDVLRQLAAQFGLHMRRPVSDERRIIIGPLGDNHGYTFTNPQMVSPAASNHTAGIIGKPKTTTNREIMVNRIIAYGGSYEDSGGDTVSLTLPLENRVETDTTVHNRMRGGQAERYVEDGASVAMWGAREKVITFSDIVPVSNATADIERAEDALKRRAVYALARNGQPVVQHDFSAQTYNRARARIGDIVALRYEATLGDAVSSISGDFYMTSITSTYQQNGQVNHAITVSDVARVMLDQLDVLVTTLQEMESLRNNA